MERLQRGSAEPAMGLEGIEAVYISGLSSFDDFAIVGLEDDIAAFQAVERSEFTRDVDAKRCGEMSSC